MVDSSVDLARKLVSNLGGGARIIGVWVGLDSTDKFRARLKSQIDRGEIVVGGIKRGDDNNPGDDEDYEIETDAEFIGRI